MSIKGYRKLTDHEIELINEVKKLESTILSSINSLERLGNHFIDKRWAAIGRTHIEQGFMAIVRSIAKPD